MSLQFLNSVLSGPKSYEDKYSTPEEILNDSYLTPMQKKIVLEAMLMEARDEIQREQEGDLKESKFIESILKIQTRLNERMD